MIKIGQTPLRASALKEDKQKGAGPVKRLAPFLERRGVRAARSPHFALPK